MGEEVLPASCARAHHRRKVQRCLDTMEQMLADGAFAERATRIGMEIELNLIDETMSPSMTNTEVLGHLDDPSFTTELGQHNLELNVPPRRLSDDSLLELDLELRNYLTDADAKASRRSG